MHEKKSTKITENSGKQKPKTQNYQKQKQNKTKN